MKSTPSALRSILLRVVFWALGLAACFGAAGIIFAGHDTLWRIVGTCAVTAGGALLLLGASRWLDAESAWQSGAATMAVIVAEYVLILGLIWNLFGNTEERVAKTIVILAATGLPAALFLAMIKRARTVYSGWTGLISFAAVFLICMTGAWSHWAINQGEERCYNLGLSLAGFTFLAVLCLLGTGQDQRHWRWLGVAAAGTGFLIIAYAILNDIHRDSALFVCIVSLAAVSAHANALMECPLKPAHRWLLWGTIGAGIATAVCVDLQQLTRPWQEELLGRMAGATAIVGGCGTLALAVLARLQQRTISTLEPESDWKELTLTCPQCQVQQTIAIGSGKCVGCGLIIEVRVRSSATVAPKPVLIFDRPDAPPIRQARPNL